MKQELNPFVFNGKIGRAGFVCTTVVLTIAGVLLDLACYGFSTYPDFPHVPSDMVSTVSVSYILAAVVLILSIGCGVKRLRDIGVTPWAVVIGLIPVLNVFYWIYLAFTKSSVGDTQK